MIERTTVRLPRRALSRAKRKAAEQGRTLTSLIEDGLRRVIAEDRKKEKAPRVLPRVSSATGGLMPGNRYFRFRSTARNGRPRIPRADEAL